jgi:phage tail tape-measure protein
MSKSDNEKAATLDANEDPLTGAPGAHPVGVAVGATGGAAAGAAVGAVGGPVGIAIGAAVGGIAGGLAGKGAAEAINPTIEDEYWRGAYVERPYVETGRNYEYYRPAYRFGWESYSQYENRQFDELDETLAREWDTRRGNSEQTWQEAREAARDAWKRASDPQRLPYAGRRHA